MTPSTYLLIGLLVGLVFGWIFFHPDPFGRWRP